MFPAAMDRQRQAFWTRQAGMVAIRHNCGWWLFTFLRLAVFACIAFACGVLVLRNAGGISSWIWLVFVGGLAACACVAAWQLRRHWCSRRDGMVWLEARMHLHNRLTAAAAGVGEFPPERVVESGLRWRWQRIFAPLIGGAAIVLAAVWIPVRSDSSASARVELPPALAQVETWVERLEDENVVDEPRVQELRAALEALKDRPEEHWYDHQSLEAAAHLRDQTAQSLQSLQRNLQTATSALAALQRIGDGLSASALEKVDRSLAEAIQGMELGNLPLDRETLGQLKAIDAKNVRTLSAAEVDALRERLANGTSVCEACIGVGIEGNAEQMLAIPSGGLSRGPGTVPLTLADEETDLQSSAVEGIRTGDLSRALPGEIAGIASGEHEVDRATYSGPVAAGKAVSTGEGGDAVWRDSLTPSERETLRRFFK